jgi:hypothetical protein
MTRQEEIAAMRARIASAHSEGAAGQAAGSQRKYVDAYLRGQAHEVELARLRQEGLRAFAGRRKKRSRPKAAS